MVKKVFKIKHRKKIQKKVHNYWVHFSTIKMKIIEMTQSIFKRRKDRLVYPKKKNITKH